MAVLTNITWIGPSREAGKRDISMALRKETFFSLVLKCSTPSRQEGLVLHECFEIGMNVNIKISPCLKSCDEIFCLR